jgi:hypothetical protein
VLTLYGNLESSNVYKVRGGACWRNSASHIGELRQRPSISYSSSL